MTITASAESAPTFLDLGVHPDLCAALAKDGITTAFPIQAQTLPIALSGHDVIGQAKTGTGKTLGFGLPLLQRIWAPTDPEFNEQPHPGRPQALVVVPTRELGVQVSKDLAQAGSERGIRVLAVYGGRSYEPQVNALAEGIEVVVGTPGRILDLHGQRHLQLDQVKILVLDEADEMLDMGFLPDVERIVAATPPIRQTMLFSATMPSQIVQLARRYMSRPTHVRAIDPSSESAVVDAIEQHVWRSHPLDKPELLARILQVPDRDRVIIFCRTKRTTQQVADELAQRGFTVGSIHGDLAQDARERALNRFRQGTIDVLVATDVAARGIDIDDVSHVINYECPDDEKTYVHRIGRTGRAGSSGVAITLVDWGDVPRWKMINKALGLAFTEPVETYSSSPHLYASLGVPEGVGGRVGKPTGGSSRPKAASATRGQSNRGKNTREKTERPRSSDGAKRSRKRTRTNQSAQAENAPAAERKPRQRNRRRVRTQRVQSSDGNISTE